MEAHIAGDAAKFADLYAKNSEHERFASRVKGAGKGAAWALGALTTITTAIAKAKGMF